MRGTGKRRMVFLAIEKAFDQIPHKLMCTLMASQWPMSTGCSSSTTMPPALSTVPLMSLNRFPSEGSTLSSLLFILCMNTVTADLQMLHPWTLLYADNVMLACKTWDGIEWLVNQWKTHLYEFRLRFNLAQTEHLECSIQTDSMIIINGTPFVKVSDFCYLGSRITTDGDTFLAAQAWVNVA